jgi:DNA-binding GntR family transcriptional regulator
MARRAVQSPELDLSLETPAPRASATDAAYFTLREAILARRLPAGTPLIEASLAKQFGISKTPVREALQRLVHSGLVDYQMAQGATVHTLTQDEIHEVFELRLLLEPVALCESIPYLSADDFARLDGVMSEACAARDENDYHELSRLNSIFHTRLYSRAPNRLMVHWLDSLTDRRRLITMEGWSREDRSRTELDEHAGILAAAHAGNPPLAAARLVQHIQRFHELVQMNGHNG